MPYFSIIIPVYNREQYIVRAINSCLSQDFDDFEIIAVDDGSSDGSVEVLKSFNDPRLRLICHKINRGRCPSRNTGMKTARGTWFVFLDSDDELLPGALRLIYQRAAGADEKVGAIRFMCQNVSGQLSPDPSLKQEIWDYEGYVRWLESVFHGKGESLPCVRARTFPESHFPNNHSEEGLYHLELAKRFLTMSCSDVVRVYHQDAENQVTRPSARRQLLYAADAAANVEKVLELHGNALTKWAPSCYYGKLQAGAVNNFLSGQRIKGLKYATRSLFYRPLSMKIAAIVVFGLLGRKMLAWTQASRSRFNSFISEK